MRTDFISQSVVYGLREGEFDFLPAAAKRKLVRLMARISEQSFRRGFQHGVVIGHRRCIDPSELRFNRSLDRAPFTDQPQRGFTSIERLFMECGVLDMIGFDGEQPL